MESTLMPMVASSAKSGVCSGLISSRLCSTAALFGPALGIVTNPFEVALKAAHQFGG
jgi:hypothetical protein